MQFAPSAASGSVVVVGVVVVVVGIVVVVVGVVVVVVGGSDALDVGAAVVVVVGRDFVVVVVVATGIQQMREISRRDMEKLHLREVILVIVFDEIFDNGFS